MSNWSITEEEVDEIIAASREMVWEPFPGATIVALSLPNGFVISSQSACINPEDYDRELGVKYCRENLKSKVWELYGFVRKSEFAEENGAK